MKLGKWVRNVRFSIRKQNQGLQGNIKVTRSQVKLLKAIDFNFGGVDEDEYTLENCSKEIGMLSTFANKFGHTRIPDDHELADWMNEMKRQKAEGVLDPGIEKIMICIGVQLETLSFIKGVNKYCEMKDVNEIEKGSPLFFWYQDITSNCSNLSRGNLKQDQWETLKAVGFDFGKGGSAIDSLSEKGKTIFSQIFCNISYPNI